MLILCEGELTEPNYFHEIRIEKRLRKQLVEIVPGADAEGTDPSALVRAAKKLRADAKKEGLPFDEVWCVFDRDQHLRFPAAIDQARKLDIKIAVSVPCFELWFLLHLQDQTAHIERDALCSKLKKVLPGGYAKAAKGMYAALGPDTKSARKRARSLAAQHKRNRAGEFDNPSTTAWQLVDALLAI